MLHAATMLALSRHNACIKPSQCLLTTAGLLVRKAETACLADEKYMFMLLKWLFSPANTHILPSGQLFKPFFLLFQM